MLGKREKSILDRGNSKVKGSVVGERMRHWQKVNSSIEEMVKDEAKKTD